VVPQDFPVAEPMGALRSAGTGWGALPAPWSTGPLRDVQPVKAGAPGGDKGADPRPVARSWAPSLESELAHGKPSRVADGGRHPAWSSFTFRSRERGGSQASVNLRGCENRSRFSKAQGNDEGCSGGGGSGERRRSVSLVCCCSAAPPLCGVSRSIGAGRSPRGRRLVHDEERDLRLRPWVVDSCRSRRASSAPGARAGKHRFARVGMA
jgi:hypothetical protein